MKKPKALRVKKAPKPKTIKPIKIKAFKPSRMAKRAKPYKAPVAKPVKEEPQTVKGVLAQLKKELPFTTAGEEDPKPPRGRMGATGGGRRRKTAKTQEQLDKEVQAYGKSDGKKR